MFVVCQQPLADARPFLKDTRRLLAPDWPDAEPGRAFVRSIGAIRPRVRGGEGSWPGEGVYCDARRLVRFASPPYRWTLGAASPGGVLAGEFRRLFSDGSGVVRLEVGVSLSRPAKAPPAPGLDGEGCLDLLAACLGMPVRVPAANGRYGPLEFLSAARPIARRLLECTTAVARPGTADSTDFSPQPWWLEPQRPMVLAEYRDGEIEALPPLARAVALGAPPAAGLTLSHLNVTRRQWLTTVWFLHVAEGADADTLRRLRIHLFRLHAERECLRQILRLVARDAIPIERGEAESERLQRYLDKAWDIFFAETRYGIQQSPILETAYRYDDLVSEGDRPALEDRLATIRGNVARKLSRIVAAQTAAGDAPPTTYIDMRGAGNVTLQTGERPMNDNSINTNTGGGSISNSVLGSGNSIQDSFKTINDSGASEDLKTKLTDLTNAVAELCKALPPDQAETTARDLKTFNEEATAKAPRKSILEAIGGALSKTAEAVATVGPPVVALVKAILLLV